MGDDGRAARLGHGLRGAGARVAGGAARLEAVERQIGRGVWSGVALLLVLVMVLNGGKLPGGRAPVVDARFSATAFPVAAVARLRADGLPPGRGFSTVEWGGYLIYALPGNRVFVDSRFDFYGSGILSDYVSIMGVAPGWDRLLARYAIHWALVPADAPLAQAMRTSGGWSCRAMDGTGVAELCVRAGGAAP
ncbi:MAG TPA: hypothetical protein VIG30_04385 [Ktedonobacterales bacterium]